MSKAAGKTRRTIDELRNEPGRKGRLTWSSTQNRGSESGNTFLRRKGEREGSSRGGGGRDGGHGPRVFEGRAMRLSRTKNGPGTGTAGGLIGFGRGANTERVSMPKPAYAFFPFQPYQLGKSRPGPELFRRLPPAVTPSRRSPGYSAAPRPSCSHSHLRRTMCLLCCTTYL